MFFEYHGFEHKLMRKNYSSLLVMEGYKQIFDVVKRLSGELDLKCMFSHIRLKNIQDFRLGSFDLMMPWLM
jgi:hypothetical protein